MARRLRRWLTLFAAVSAFCVIAVTAQATHPRPKSASPVQVSLVPAYQQCGGPNRTHGPPLAFPSCNPTVQTSGYLTVGTPDANGASANSAGFWKVKTLVGTPGPPDDSQVLLSFQVDDVRCRPGASPCGNANASGGPDYTGELQADATIRMTDHNNAATAGGGTDPATVVDIPMPANVSCTSTADTSIGSTCTLMGGPVVPALSPECCEGQRMVVQIGQVRVDDGGADGIAATTPNIRFLSQGIFIP